MQKKNTVIAKRLQFDRDNVNEEKILEMKTKKIEASDQRKARSIKITLIFFSTLVFIYSIT